MNRMLLSKSSLFLILSLEIFSSVNSTLSQKMQYCEKSSGSDDPNCKPQSIENKRYILYDINPSEGFNLRRDVYVRVAAFVKKCNDIDKMYRWHLVLPPWDQMYHWRSKELGAQKLLPWGHFFDISSLERYVPVLEMYEFIREYSLARFDEWTEIDRVYVLQNDMKMFETGKFEEKNELIDCEEKKTRYYKIGPEEYSGHFWGYENVTARYLNCLLFHGTASDLRKNLDPRSYRSFMFDRMEIALHDDYGSREYWRARRSMRYNEQFYKIAEKFRSKYLESEDSVDNTPRVIDWRDEKERRNASGGPYLAVHLRRRDFLTGRAESVPTIEKAADQLMKKLQELDLKILFVATDADEDEYNRLKDRFMDYRVYRYVPSTSMKKKLKDGGIAIIDQIICSHARYFIGTHESTFTFRIQEDREIMGFPAKTTFNRLCGKEKNCSPGGQWEIVWQDKALTFKYRRICRMYFKSYNYNNHGYRVQPRKFFISSIYFRSNSAELRMFKSRRIRALWMGLAVRHFFRIRAVIGQLSKVYYSTDSNRK